MEIQCAATPADRPTNAILSVRLDSNEELHLGDEITIQLLDRSFEKRQIKSMRKCKRKAKRSKWLEVSSFSGGESGEIEITGIASNRIHTTRHPSFEEMDRMAKIINITPFKELRSGKLSIHDYVESGYKVPQTVIVYLQTTKPYLMSPGIYEHPFKPGHRLLGPYRYTDDKYCWDRDTWKYVVKYGLKLPQEFIDHVMSPVGTHFLEEFKRTNPSWEGVIRSWKDQSGMLCLLPDNAGNEDLGNF